MRLTQRSAARSGACVWDLLAVGIHTPTLPNAGVALCGLVCSILVALWDVLTDNWPRTEEGEEACTRGGGSLGTLSVPLTLGFLTFCRQRVLYWNYAALIVKKMKDILLYTSRVLRTLFEMHLLLNRGVLVRGSSKKACTVSCGENHRLKTSGKLCIFVVGSRGHRDFWQRLCYLHTLILQKVSICETNHKAAITLSDGSRVSSKHHIFSQQSKKQNKIGPLRDKRRSKTDCRDKWKLTVAYSKRHCDKFWQGTQNDAFQRPSGS